MRFNVSSIAPVTPTSQMVQRYNTRNSSNWEGKPSDNVFEEVFTKTMNKVIEKTKVNKTKVDISLQSNAEAYRTHADKKVNITDIGRRGKDMYIGFVTKEKNGCYVSAKVPLPTEKGGLHIGVRYYNPEEGTFNVYPKTKAGYPHTHFFTKTIVRSSKWKERASEVMEKGMTQCLEKYGVGKPVNIVEKSTQQDDEEIRTILKGDAGSYWKGSCYNTQSWQKQKRECWGIRIGNFGGSQKTAFITLLPYKDYTKFETGKSVKYKPSDFNCEPLMKYNGLSCTLKSGKTISLVQEK